MRAVRVAAALAAVALVATGCNDRRQALEDGLLRIEDFPAGFRSDPPDEREQREGNGPGELENCEAVESAMRAGVDTRRVSDEFMAPGRAAGNEVTLYHDEVIAGRLMRAWSEEADAKACLEMVLSAVGDLLGSDPLMGAAISTMELDVARLRPPRAKGDAREAWRARLDLGGPGGQVAMVLDLVVVRRGAAVSVFHFFSDGTPDEALRDRLVRRAMRRLDAAL